MNRRSLRWLVGGVAAAISVGGVSTLARGEHLQYDGAGKYEALMYYGTGDPDDDRHIHSFTQIEDDNGGCHHCEDTMSVEIRRADRRYPNSYEPGPYAECDTCHHVHVGLNTRYAECHYYTKHTHTTGEPVTFHHNWCGPIRG